MPFTRQSQKKYFNFVSFYVWYILWNRCLNLSSLLCWTSQFSDLWGIVANYNLVQSWWNSKLLRSVKRVAAKATDILSSFMDRIDNERTCDINTSLWYDVAEMQEVNQFEESYPVSRRRLHNSAYLPLFRKRRSVYWDSQVDERFIAKRWRLVQSTFRWELTGSSFATSVRLITQNATAHPPVPSRSVFAGRKVDKVHARSGQNEVPSAIRHCQISALVNWRRKREVHGYHIRNRRNLFETLKVESGNIG